MNESKKTLILTDGKRETTEIILDLVLRMWGIG
jgi:hypothetical protein